MTPTVVDEPPSCGDLGLREAVVVRSVRTGVTEFEVDGETRRLGLVVARDGPGTAFNWTSDLGMAAVVVRGGGDAHVYDYREALAVAGVEAVFTDDRLTAPFDRPPGRFGPITSITFCYEDDGTGGVFPAAGPDAGGALVLAGTAAAAVVAVRRR